MIYDILMRLPLAAWAVFCIVVSSRGFTGETAIDVASHAATIAFLGLLALAALLRRKPVAKSQAIEPKLSAMIGTFAVYWFAFSPRVPLPAVAGIVSTLLVIIGTVAAIVALVRLGRSFSIMPEARRLVTTGVYRYVRHPLYLAEELAVIGVFLQFISVQSALVLAVQIGFQLRRIHNEETILAASFPDYAAYQASTARLVPGLI